MPEVPQSHPSLQSPSPRPLHPSLCHPLGASRGCFLAHKPTPGPFPGAGGPVIVQDWHHKIREETQHSSCSRE